MQRGPEPTLDPLREWAHELADGPVEALEQQGLGYLAQSIAWPQDPRLVAGLERLADRLAELPTTNSRVELSKGILTLCERHSWIDHAIPRGTQRRLEDLVR